MARPKRLNFFHYLSLFEKILYGFILFIFIISSFYTLVSLIQGFETKGGMLFSWVGIFIMIFLVWLLGKFQKLGLDRGVQRNPELLKNFEIKQQVDFNNKHVADMSKLGRIFASTIIIRILFSLLFLIIILYFFRS